MLTLGLNFGSHDAAASLVHDGKIIAATEEERYNYKKHTKDYPSGAIQSCLEIARVTTRDIDSVALFVDPRLQLLLPFINLGSEFPKSLGYLKHSMKWIKNRNLVKQITANSDFFRKDCRVDLISHHLAHAASCFFTSPWDDAAIVTIDGRGEYETACIFEGKGTSIVKKHSVLYPHSIGYFYSAMTKFLGFKPQSDEYKVMGLAAYGTDKLLSVARQLVKFDALAGKFYLNLAFFDHHKTSGNERMLFSKRMSEIFGSSRQSYDAIEDRHADIAYAVQKVAEENILSFICYAKQKTGSNNLCMAGGVALNCVANAVVAKNSGFSNIFIPPVPHDAGASLGAALVSCSSRRNPKFIRHALNEALLGPEYNDAEIESAIESYGIISAYKCENKDDVAVKLLRENKIIGWFQGRMEFGPRALGARSILAVPSHIDIRERINRIIKQREPFRPFAPIVLEYYARDYFDIDEHAIHLYRYMLSTTNVKENVRSRIPAVVHYDGSARVQVIMRNQGNPFENLLDSYKKNSGEDVLLNTSFNIAGEPIVRTPQDAISTFIRTEMDALVIGNWCLEKGKISVKTGN